MSSHCLTCFGSLDRREWVRRTAQEQAAWTPRSRKWSWKTQGRRCPAKGAARPTVAVHASSAPHRGLGSETRSRRRPCWTGATGWSSKEPTSSQLSAGTTKATATKNTTELRIITFQVSTIRSLMCCCKSSSSSSARTQEDHEEQKRWGLRDVAAVFLRSLEPDQHLRGCNRRQLPSSTARWKLLLLQVTCCCSWRSQLDLHQARKGRISSHWSGPGCSSPQSLRCSRRCEADPPSRRSASPGLFWKPRSPSTQLESISPAAAAKINIQKQRTRLSGLIQRNYSSSWCALQKISSDTRSAELRLRWWWRTAASSS